MKVIIVGANAAGVACAVRLRRNVEVAHIVLLDSRAMLMDEALLRNVYNMDLRLQTVVASQYPNLLLLQNGLTGLVEQERFDHLCYFDDNDLPDVGRNRADELVGLFRPQKADVEVLHPFAGSIAYAEVGLTERALEEQQKDYMYSVLPLEKGYLKLFYNNKGHIYGFAAYGQGIPRYVDAMSAIMAHGGNINSLVQHSAYGGHNALPQLGKIAQNVIEGRVKNAYADEIDDINGEDAILLDVRSDTGTINFPNAINIPLARLREEFYQLDVEKPVVIISKTGKSAYIASRFLSQRGYKTSVLTGGLEYYVYASSRAHGI